jgi:multisubunit Na+/H+ antiporter MnhB subunit
MSLADVAFLVGPIGAVGLVSSVAALLVVVHVRDHAVVGEGRRHRWAVYLAASLSVGVGLTWLSYWMLWGRAFGYQDVYQSVPAPLEAAVHTTMALCAGGVVLLGATAVASLAMSRRTSTRTPG